ncbi:MAG: hypothetical protein NTV01_13035 [Bacteroidia bacterium]|nr:hypothetical protein [Bacteroidia bacterium]
MKIFKNKVQFLWSGGSSSISITAFIFIALLYLSGCAPDPESRPIAAFTVSSCYTDTLTILEFDASGSTDKEDPSLALSFRWDWEHDGKWDTKYSTLPKNSHRYQVNRVYLPILEVMDQDGLVDTCSILIRITDVRKDSSITDPRDGKTYRVALIEDVWWMAQNLDYGIQINSSQYPENNNIAEKYFFNDSDSMGKIYGGLYSWEEAMNGQTSSGSQGICPPGWQVPAGKYVAALWDLVLFPYPDHIAYLGKGGYLGIDLERSGTFDIYNQREFDSFIGGFWISERKRTGDRSVPFYFAYTNLLYINNPDTNPPYEHTALSLRCIKPVHLSQ